MDAFATWKGKLEKISQIDVTSDFFFSGRPTVIFNRKDRYGRLLKVKTFSLEDYEMIFSTTLSHEYVSVLSRNPFQPIRAFDEALVKFWNKHPNSLEFSKEDNVALATTIMWHKERCRFHHDKNQQLCRLTLLRNFCYRNSLPTELVNLIVIIGADDSSLKFPERPMASEFWPYRLAHNESGCEKCRSFVPKKSKLKNK